MSNGKGRYRKNFFYIILVIVMMSIFTYGIINTSYATRNSQVPNVLVTLEKGGTSQQGNLYGTGLWFPGLKKEGIIRVANNTGRTVKVDNLGIQVKLTDTKLGIDKEVVLNSFLNNMKLSIEKGYLFAFDKVILAETKIHKLLYSHNNDDYNGYDIIVDDQFTIRNGKSIDLKYTLYMNKESGDELQDLSAQINFVINSSGDTINDPPDDPPDDPPNDPDPPVTPPSDPPPEEPPTVEEPEEPTDTQDHWAHDCIITLIEHGVIKGYPDGTIRPEYKVTRAEVAALVARALKVEEDFSKEPVYKDDIPKWVEGYVVALTDYNIYTGYPDNTFRSDKYISREEVVAVLIRGFEKSLDANNKLDFKDKDDIGFWAVDYVKSGVENNVITGYPDGTFKPKNDITRAEVFTILCKLLGLHETHVYKID
ncbi:S-layer homology domain-containing protein [Sporosalibacterium faouarense]|uniref:S-layer homology domain-containing protein n=1 Tax=Sporosalibacterium faouarense TaxID=516123 RepID=UPI00141CDF22|nr:S-layer homology domain-containing protein [Sporosalibacterium faouarense]MTI48862.1 S-layer homology domain-containing protein [Bacillota bacterium]